MNNVIVTGGTSKDIEGIATLLVNINKTMKNIDADVIVYHDGISEADQKAMKKIRQVEFVKYKCPFSKIKLLVNPYLRYFSGMIFCKYECLRLLQQYEKVMWTDYDVVIRDNLADLFDMQEQAAFVVKENSKIKDMFRKKFWFLIKNKVELEQDAITTPLFILTRKISDYNECYEWCIKKTDELMMVSELPEQGIYSMLLNEMNINYKKLKSEIYAVHPRDDKGDARIIHAYGQPKFWTGLENNEWATLNAEWKKVRNS